MSQHPARSPSTRSGTGYATKDRHLQLRTSASVEEMNNLPVAFEIVTPTNSNYGPSTPARSRSFTAYDEMMKNEDEARMIARSEGSLADIRALPSIFSTRERDAKTVGKRLHSPQSCEDLKRLPDLTFRNTPSVSGSNCGLVLSNSDYAYGPYSPVTLRNSDYAYYPPVLRNSDYAYTYDKGSTAAITPTNSSYCYVNPDGSSRLASSYPPAPSQSTPYADVSRRMEDGAASTKSLVGTEPISSAIYLGGYARELPPPRAPNSETLNKNMRGIVSIEDLTRVEVTFTERCVGDGRGNCCPLGAEMANMSTSTTSTLGRQVIRDFCRESMEEIRQLPSLSSYMFDQEEPDVFTARSLRSPAQQTADSKTAKCSYTPPKKTVSRVSTARSTQSTDQDGFKYYPEAVDPNSSRRRRRSSSSSRRQ